MSHVITLNDYLMDPAHKIGRGSSGIVYKGHHRRTNQLAAIKRVDISNFSSKMTRIWNEIQIMKSLSHPNIVRLYDIFIDIEKEYLYLIMEYCEGSDLSDYISEFTLDFGEIHNYFSQIKDGMKYLHSKGIVHRDLKPHNLLLHKGIVKIADFGLSTALQTDSNNHLMQTICGSPLYMSPEIIEHQKYTAKSDLWSLGVILYQLIYHTHPLKRCKNLPELTQRMKNQKIEYPDQPPVDPLTMDLMQALLSKNCHNRITWDEFFNHSWFHHVPTHLGNSLRASPNDSTGIFQLSVESSHQSQTSSVSAQVSSGSNPIADFDLSQYVQPDYQKKPETESRPILPNPHKNPSPRLEDVYGTSAPQGDAHDIDYSPSRLNFNSVGGHISQSMLQYASQTFNWLKSGIDY